MRKLVLQHLGLHRKASPAPPPLPGAFRTFFRAEWKPEVQVVSGFRFVSPLKPRGQKLSEGVDLELELAVWVQATRLPRAACDF